MASRSLLACSILRLRVWVSTVLFLSISLNSVSISFKRLICSSLAEKGLTNPFLATLDLPDFLALDLDLFLDLLLLFFFLLLGLLLFIFTSETILILGILLFFLDDSRKFLGVLELNESNLWLEDSYSRSAFTLWVQIRGTLRVLAKLVFLVLLFMDFFFVSPKLRVFSFWFTKLSDKAVLPLFNLDFLCFFDTVPKQGGLMSFPADFFL